MPTKSWKNHPQKLLRILKSTFFSLLPWLPKRPRSSFPFYKKPNATVCLLVWDSNAVLCSKENIHFIWKWNEILIWQHPFVWFKSPLILQEDTKIGLGDYLWFYHLFDAINFLLTLFAKVVTIFLGLAFCKFFEHANF